MALDPPASSTKKSNTLWTLASATGSGLCFLVFLLIAVIWSHPKSRKMLDRVSFRLVVCSLVLNMIFGLFGAVAAKMGGGPVWICSFSVFVFQATLQASTLILLMVALNLELVIVHHVNSWRLEKFYIAIPILVSFAITIPAYATGQYGADPFNPEVGCWYAGDSEKSRITWQISTQVIWTSIVVVTELVLSIVVLFFILRHHLRTHRSLAFLSTYREGIKTSPAPIHPPTNPSRLSRVRKTISFLQPTGSPRSNIVLAHRYNNVVLRIALYPLFSCFFNLVAAAATLLYSIRGGIHDETDVRVDLLSNFVYGGRPILYAFLTATDPALVRGIKVFVEETGVLSRWRRIRSIPPEREVPVPQRTKGRKAGNMDSIFGTGSQSTVGELPVIHIRDPRLSATEGSPRTSIILETALGSNSSLPQPVPEVRDTEKGESVSQNETEDLEDRFIARI